MGARWGINRSVAQVHALLFLSERPLHAEEIAGTLGVARSNVSTSLKELQNWGIVKLVHILGDKRDHYESLKDVWEMFRVIAEERKRREFDPTLALLRECLAEAEQEKPGSKTTQNRLKALLEFFETTGRWSEQMQRWPAPVIRKLAAAGDRILKLLS
jgi:DNA-binding transcriptional regulator GbsR (MarR family)